MADTTSGSSTGLSTSLTTGSPQSRLYTERLDSENLEIRLLHIQLALFSQPICCTLSRVSLNETPHPVYNALSYAWGDINDTRPIFVNGVSIQVTANLESALRHIRKTHKDYLPDVKLPGMWIDAVCIHQADIDEKSQQLPLMPSIYLHANNVFIWLGPGDTQSDEVMERCNEDMEFANHLKSLQPDLSLSSEEQPDVRRFWTLPREPTEIEFRTTAILKKNILRRSYWRRLWVYQEIIMAEDHPVVLCGTRMLDWRNLRFTCFQLQNLSRSPTYYSWESAHPEIQWYQGLGFTDEATIGQSWLPDVGTLSLARQAYQQNRSLSLAMLIDVGYRRLTTDPRDRVYGLIGLAPQETQRRFTINYRQHRMDVYHEVFAVLWEDAANNGFLPRALDGFSYKKTRDVLDYPSWVPDLHTGSMSGTSRSLRHQAWRDAGPVILFPDKKALALSGVLIDLLSDVVDITYLDFLKVRLGAAEMRSTQLPEGHPLRSIASLRMKEHLLWTFVDSNVLPTFRRGDEDRIWRILEGTADGWDILTEIHDENPHDPSEVNRWKSMLGDVDHGFAVRTVASKLFTTNAGFVGLGPSHVSDGDVLVYIYGALSPFILCPHGLIAGTYKMIGAAYVSGFADIDVLDDYWQKGHFKSLELVFPIY